VKLKDSSKKLERWRKIVIEASKQCGRASLMRVGEPLEFSEFIESATGTRVLFAERGGDSFSDFEPARKITAAVGSEGGWEDSEIERAREKGFQIVTLGGRILRAETAAIAIAAILQHRFGDLK
jgi:16S rRNA (uracil1498-N3)-methyltransferase